MARRPRANPFDRGTAEHVLHHRWKLALGAADRLQREASLLQTAADAERAKAEHYAKALTALGHAVEPLRIAGPQRDA